MPKGTESTLFTEQTSDSYVWGQQDGKFGRFPAQYFKGEAGDPGATGSLLDATLFSGTDYPGDTLGKQGDVYLKYDATLTTLISRGLRVVRVDELVNADDLVITDLDGHVDVQYWFLLYGYLTTGGSNRTVALLPNGDTTAGNYHAAAEVLTDISGANATTTTSYVSGTAGLIMARSQYSVDNYLRVWGSVGTRLSMYRIAEFDSLCIRTDTTEGLAQARYTSAWMTHATAVSSLTVSFGGASDFSGLLYLYTNR